MKKHTIKKAFLTFAVAISLFYSVFSLSVFAIGGPPIIGTWTCVFRNSLSSTVTVYYSHYGNDTTFTVSAYSDYSLVLSHSGDFECYCRVGGSYYSLYYLGSEVSHDSNNPTIVYIEDSQVLTIGTPFNASSSYYFISLVNDSAPNTPTPDPSTPTPDPTTPTPSVATPTPDPESTGIPFPTSTNIPQPSPLTSDTEFWTRMGNDASGLWGVITSAVSGIFSNVVMRNLAIYIPLFGLILGLIIYTITLGGGDDN